MSSDNNNVLKFGIPKGSLQDATINLFDRAGYKLHVSSRSYFPTIDDPEISCLMFRAQEMSRYIEDGVLDVGITGHDWVVENESDVHEVCELPYSRATSKPAKWVLAVPQESDYHSPKDLEGGIISTELLNTTKRYFEKHGVNVKVEFSWGATEVKARLVSGIVDITETGSSIRANKLRVIDEILVSTTRLVCSHEAWADPFKRTKIENLALLLQGAIAARNLVGLKMNVDRKILDDVLKMLPSETSPTVNSLVDSDWAAIEVIVEEAIERDLVPELHRLGAKGIFSYPLKKVI